MSSLRKLADQIHAFATELHDQARLQEAQARVSVTEELEAERLKAAAALGQFKPVPFRSLEELGEEPKGCSLSFSGSDGVADPFRRKSRPVSLSRRDHIDDVKVCAEALLACMNDKSGDRDEQADLLCLAHAQQKLEEAVMWAVKGLSA